MARLSNLVNRRLTVADLQATFTAKAVAVDSGARRDKFEWAVDSYGTLSITMYVPKGESLPKGGITLEAADFDVDRGVDKTDRGRVSILHESEMGTDEQGKPDHILVVLEAPADYDFEGVTITQ